ncbi:HSPB1-associated protein 1-like [Scleropages formosus]|uniref:HSPB1-associated protein 1-like n=2 Tax=Scleropages formosus TaxID=113540 RepID=A0A0P7U4A6_SCLFO|nr:HSPB1-associated protein 1 isoform X2 [Scleropages formosus]KPP61916.1 HSPB1-associated protein 1-like [Scleropages formosus]
MDAKPFAPEEAREIVESLQQPAVFLNMTHDWTGLQWTVEHLATVLGEKMLRFRIGEQTKKNTPQFETQCSYVEATMWDFLCWTKGQRGASPNPFCDYPVSEFWAYADYKYIAVLFQDKASMFKNITWSDFGYPGRNGRESTLWVGTDGANTPCHQDSYGCNLVLQVQGRKKWHLFPPGDTACLYPTRIPYEESSVFSQVNVVWPDLQRFPAFSAAKRHVVTLHPGQVLFVPRHWWHYVESVDPLTVSVNSWIEMEADDEARVGEALTKTIVCALKTTASHDNKDEWLNPTEVEVSSHEENLQYLSLAVQMCSKKRREQHCSHPPSHNYINPPSWKRDARGHPKQSTSTTVEQEGYTSAIPFGPNLVPVALDPDYQTTSCSFFSELSAGVMKGMEAPSQQRAGETDTGRDGNAESPGHKALSNNDLLEALLHPKVIALVTKLLLDRQKD